MNFIETKNHYQCRSENLGNFVYDTSVSASRGNYSTQFNFQTVHHGWSLFCAEYCTATGEIATMHVENNITFDGFNFPFINSFLKNISTDNYKFIYVVRRKRSKIHFCRIKQVYPNGDTGFKGVGSISPKKFR